MVMKSRESVCRWKSSPNISYSYDRTPSGGSYDGALPECLTGQEDALATADVSHLLRGRYMDTSDPVPFQRLSLLLTISDDKPQHRQEYALG
jgi:hypothetical protein